LAPVPAVIYYSDSAQFGGAEQALIGLLERLDRRRWQPRLIYHEELATSPLAEAARRLEVPAATQPRPIGRAGAPLLGRFVILLRQLRPDLFHANLASPLAGAHGLMAAILAGVPAVATEQLSAPITFSRWALHQRLLAHAVCRYITVSHELAVFLQRTMRFPAGKIRVVHNGIPLEPYEHLTEGRANGAVFTVLTVARMDAQKGHRHLLDAAARLPGIRFLFAGDGPEKAALSQRASHLGIADRITFLGQRQDVPALLASCDLFVLPSLFEGLPLAILEAMAAGKAVVASAVGGSPEAVLHGETGLLVPPADAASLASAICTLAADPDLRQRMGAAGRSRVSAEFSADTMARRTVAVYEELLGRAE
jgi:glycosyltransferase involved in cell wall biosynthesis